jgi:hypothetical protein
MEIRELVGRYLNWTDRYVAPRPRCVVQSHWEAVQQLAKKIEAGDDLTPPLSDDIGRLGYVPPKSPRRNEARRRGVERIEPLPPKWLLGHLIRAASRFGGMAGFSVLAAQRLSSKSNLN